MKATEHSAVMQFVMAQRGARRGYAVPDILARGGILERFYTDACGNVGWGRWLAAAGKLPDVPQRLSRLANRQIPQTIASRTQSFIGPDLRLVLRSLQAGNDPVAAFRHASLHSLELGQLAANTGFGRAKGLYVMLSEFSPLIMAAREKGLLIVSDVYILISTERILAEERARFPEWSSEVPDYGMLRREMGVEDVLFTQVDHYVCPSMLVQEDLVQNWGVPIERTHLVPYGMNPKWLELEPHPRPGKIIFVGSANLRKGIHYLAMAAEELKSRGRYYEFRIVGNVTEHVRHQPLCRHLNFAGRIPRERIHEEFQTADLFVLPSLAEGSAGVTYEALAAGVPQVVTRAAGSVARDGIDGFIVPERDPIALADAIEQIVEDRELRDRMALAARARARDYTWEMYGERLVAALRSLV